jgi:DNA repair exonuclease SbcCD nuclease subunit
MTKKDLVKIIREVVKREVQKEVKKIFIEEQVSKPTKVIEQKVQQKKAYTKNKSLNDVLNETVGLTKTQKNQTEEYPTLGGGAFDTNRMAEMMGYGKTDDVKRDLVAVDSFKKAGVKSSQVPEALTNALTRDYSDLMKALDKKGK